MKPKDSKAEKIEALLDAFKGDPGKLQNINKKEVIYVREVNGQLVDRFGKPVDVSGYKTVVRFTRRVISKEHPDGIIK